MSKKAESFFWGVAGSAFQIEGTPANSDWRKWSQTAGKIKDGSSAAIAANFWEDYSEHFNLTRDLGANAYRLSIAWDRIQPAENQWDEDALTHYEKVIAELRSKGLEPFVTLDHFVLPEWLAKKDGYLSPQFPQYFAAYAQRVVTKLSVAPARVRYWVTFNEPTVSAQMGFLMGEWPPGETEQFRKAVQSLVNKVKAHIFSLSELAIFSKREKLKWSIAHHYRPFHPKTSRPQDRASAALLHWVFNLQFLNSLSGNIFFCLPGAAPYLERVKIKRPSLDYLGLNYYGRMMSSFIPRAPFVLPEEGSGKKSDLGWEIYPQGLADSLRFLYRKYRLPILITENGIADAADSNRAEFIESHLQSMFVARSEGVKLMGYLHWSLTDNFEWHEGLSSRFGLVAVDYTKERPKFQPRPSYYRYRELIDRYSKLLLRAA